MTLKNRERGFTLIELLVVISIMALLSSVVMASLNAARVKARDARRQADMAQIMNAVAVFYNTNGCLPTPGSTACGGFTTDSNAGAWDYSSQGAGFMTFLVTAGLMSRSPADPTNNMTGDAAPPGTYAYRYYCYPQSDLNAGLHLGYWSERTGGYVMKSNPRNNNWSDNTYICL